MKYLFSLLTFLLFSFSVSSQALIYVDVSYDNLEDALEEGAYIDSEEYITISSGERFKTVTVKTYLSDDYAILYYDSEGVCYGNGIYYKKVKDLNKTIETYNKVFVIENDNTWKSYNNGSEYIAQLLTTDDGAYFIFWSKTFK